MDLLGAVEASFFEEFDAPSFLDELFDSRDDFPSDEAPSDEAPSDEAPSDEAPSDEDALALDESLDLRA